jgi:hypothetical protein
MFGTPVGLDANVTAGATSVGLGDTIAPTAGAIFTLAVPRVLDLDPTRPAPELSATIYRVDAGGVHALATGPGPTVTAPADQPGAYRAEIHIKPHHLGGYLGHLGTAPADHDFPWIYTNPIYVEAPP